MIVLKSGLHVDAMEVIKEYGFIDETPEISLGTGKVFSHDGRIYRFAGWDHLDQRRCWQDIKMVELTV